MEQANPYSSYNRRPSGNTDASSPSPKSADSSSNRWEPPKGRPVQTGPEFVYQAYPINDSAPRNGSGKSSRSQQPPQNRHPSGMTEEEFANLCASISSTVSSIAQTVGKGLGAAGSAMGDAIGSAISQAKDAHDASQEQAHSKNTSRRSVYGAAMASSTQRRAQLAKMKKRFKSPAAVTASGAVMTFIGGCGVVTFGSSLLVALFDAFFMSPALFTAPESIAIGAMSGIGCALFGWLAAAGIGRLRLSQRFKSFRRIFANREVCSIEEISNQLQQKPSKTLSQARKMVRRGLLPQGHIDDECTTLMVTDDAYKHYRQLKQQEQQRLADEKERAAAQKKAAQTARAQQAGLPAEAKYFLQQGNDFMRRIRILDIAIDDKEVSAKIVGIERVLGQILKRVKDNPDVLGSLPRLMDYYLPTTVKLLEAYDDLEEQPVQGENIAKSRREIENTLDVLHQAYKKLLDDTFQDMSLDVSSDITVLHAVLAQEGLADNPFGKGEAGSRLNMGGNQGEAAGDGKGSGHVRGNI